MICTEKLSWLAKSSCKEEKPKPTVPPHTHKPHTHAPQTQKPKPTMPPHTHQPYTHAQKPHPPPRPRPYVPRQPRQPRRRPQHSPMPKPPRKTAPPRDHQDPLAVKPTPYPHIIAPQKPQTIPPLKHHAPGNPSHPTRPQGHGHGPVHPPPGHPVPGACPLESVHMYLPPRVLGQDHHRFLNDYVQPGDEIHLYCLAYDTNFHAYCVDGVFYWHPESCPPVFPAIPYV